MAHTSGGTRLACGVCAVLAWAGGVAAQVVPLQDGRIVSSLGAQRGAPVPFGVFNDSLTRTASCPPPAQGVCSTSTATQNTVVLAGYIGGTGSATGSRSRPDAVFPAATSFFSVTFNLLARSTYTAEVTWNNAFFDLYAGPTDIFEGGGGGQGTMTYTGVLEPEVYRMFFQASTLEGPTGQVRDGSVSYVLRLRPMCAADVNASGAITIDDFFAFLSLFSANCLGDPTTTCQGRTADFDNDGALTVNDFFAFLSAYSAGCG